jgi:hypothetical protein
MHKNAMKCSKTLSKWCKNKHGASKIIDMLETYQLSSKELFQKGLNGVRKEKKFHAKKWYKKELV